MIERYSGTDGKVAALDRLAQNARRLTEALQARQGRTDFLAETPYGRAVQCIHRGLHRKQEAMRGEFDKDIRILFSNYLASKFPGASHEMIESHARKGFLGWWRRTRSLGKTVLLNMSGTTLTGLVTSLGPKLALSAGTLSGAVSTAFLGGVGSAAGPALVAFAPFALAFGATHVARRFSRDERENRKAGNILRKALREGPKLHKLRTAIANGTDIFKEFDELIHKRGILGAFERHGNIAWTLGMLGVGGVLGIYGAGSMEIRKSIWENYTDGFSSERLAYANLIANPEEFWKLVREFRERFRGTEDSPGAWSTGIHELTGLGKYFWQHAVAAIGLGQVPNPSEYARGFPR